jgi:hypothetical protein
MNFGSRIHDRGFMVQNVGFTGPGIGCLVKEDEVVVGVASR